MASKIEFGEFMADQLREAGTITYKKMLVNMGFIAMAKFLR